MLKHLPAALRLTLPLLLALLAGCAHTPPALPSVPAPAIPPLPASARQPAPPASCLPTCSDGWRQAVEALLKKPTGAASPGPNVLGDTKP